LKSKYINIFSKRHGRHVTVYQKNQNRSLVKEFMAALKTMNNGKGFKPLVLDYKYTD